MSLGFHAGVDADTEDALEDRSPDGQRVASVAVVMHLQLMRHLHEFFQSCNKRSALPVHVHIHVDFRLSSRPKMVKLSKCDLDSWKVVMSETAEYVHKSKQDGHRPSQAFGRPNDVRPMS